MIMTNDFSSGDIPSSDNDDTLGLARTPLTLDDVQIENMAGNLASGSSHAPDQPAIEFDPDADLHIDFGDLGSGSSAYSPQASSGNIETACSFITGVAGSGKCLARGTLVMLHTGRSVPVESIQPGDLVMGPDSLPRKVMGLSSGYGDMFRVIPVKGEPYEVNKSHILTLKMSRKSYRKNPVIDISLQEYFKQTGCFRRDAKGFKVGIDLPLREVPIDPYFLGVWLGDGTSTNLQITNPEIEIIDYVKEFTRLSGLLYTFRESRRGNSCPYISVHCNGTKRNPNPLTLKFRDMNLFNNKHVPDVYKYNDKSVRLSILAGLLDTDGHLSAGCFDYLSKVERLSDDVVFLARSVGLAAYKQECQKSCQVEGFLGTYFRVSISGNLDIIPTIVPRKKASPRRQIKDVLVTGISVVPIGMGYYYGFELDGDGRFVLGDFTVTHNSYAVKKQLEDDPEFAVLCATTGISAINLNAITIHSLLGFFDTDSLRDAYLSGAAQRKLKKLVDESYKNVVIDEVSMLSKDSLDLLVRVFDDVNQNLAVTQKPIGLILTGDFMQLPPIADKRVAPGSRVKAATPWAFDALSWHRFEAKTTRLTKIWRQTDQQFLDALNYARAGKGSEAAGILAASGVAFNSTVDLEFDGTTLVGKNDEVDRFNQIALDRVKGRLIGLPARRWGKQRNEWKNIPERTVVREGAYVMLLSNRYNEFRELEYANGDCGHVKGIQPSQIPGEPPTIMVELVRNNKLVYVSSIVRNVESKDKPDDMSGEVDIPSKDDLGKWIGKQHYRGAAKKYVAGQVEYFPIRLAYATTVHKCVDVNERVPVFGRGMTKLSNVEQGSITPHGQILAVADTIRKAITIRTDRGYEIVCSAEHRWQTKNGMLETQNLSFGDSIQLALGRPFPGSNQVSPELAWVMGALVGDGNYSDQRDGTLHMSCAQDFELGDRFKQYVNQVEGLRCEWRSDKRGLHSTSKPFRRRLFDLGLNYVTAHEKTIPESIWEAGWEAWGAFLQGLFDADGHVGKSFIVLTCASTQMAKDVQNMLLALGILSKRRKFDVGYQGKASRYWQVTVASSGLSDFRERVGFSIIRKREKLATIKPNRAFTRTDGFDQIVAIEYSDKTIAMRDVEIAAPHVMSFGPFIGHNSQGLSLDRCQIDFRGWMMGGAAMGYTAMSRCRTLEGLRIVGRREDVGSKCKADARVLRWL